MNSLKYFVLNKLFIFPVITKFSGYYSSDYVKILVCTHSKLDIIKENESCFLPIQVGKSNSTIDLSYISDNTGDNISKKNSNYCELTAMYWAFKNLDNVEYIGLCHYRRFFNFEDFSNYSVTEISSRYFLQNKKKFRFSKKHLLGYDIILAKPYELSLSINDHYSKYHKGDDLKMLREVVFDCYPEYIESYDTIMQSFCLSAFNMLVARNELFKEYSEWLFSILFEVEKRIILSDDPYQKRVFGFMGERLLNVFVFHKKLKINYKSVAVILDNK